MTIVGWRRGSRRRAHEGGIGIVFPQLLELVGLGGGDLAGAKLLLMRGETKRR
jgi:hypothetical protein